MANNLLSGFKINVIEGSFLPPGEALLALSPNDYKEYLDKMKEPLLLERGTCQNCIHYRDYFDTSDPIKMCTFYGSAPHRTQPTDLCVIDNKTSFGFKAISPKRPSFQERLAEVAAKKGDKNDTTEKRSRH